MDSRYRPAVFPLLVAASLSACESVEPAETFDVAIAVDCSNCTSHPANANLRVFLRPADALVGDTILTDRFVSWNEWILLGTGTDIIESAFQEVSSGDYVITAVSPYPAQLGGACRTEGTDTAIVSPRSYRNNPARRPTGLRRLLALRPGHRDGCHAARARHPAGLLNLKGEIAMSRTLLFISLSVLAACDGTEPEPLIEYAAVPVIALDPDQFTVRQGDWLEIARHPDETAPRNEPAYVHVSYLREQDNPFIVRCDREPDGFADCDELERAGMVIVGQDAFDALMAELGGCGTGNPNNSSGGGFTLTVSSCFGLIRYKILWDSTKIDFVTNTWKDHDGSSLNFRGCGETWAAYRLFKAARSGTSIEYPLDPMFSDTVWVDVRC